MVDFATPFSGFPGCGGNVLNNPNWFSFVAGASSLSLTITPDDCLGIGNGGTVSGIQAAIYELNTVLPPQDCNSCNPSSYFSGGDQLAAQCGCTEDAITWNDLPTVPGFTYFVVIDGCGGDVCDVYVDIIQGGDPPGVDDPAGIDAPLAGFGQDTVCNGAVGYLISLGEVFGASGYIWELPDGSLEETFDPEYFVDPLPPIGGPYEYCVTARNDCDTSLQTCVELYVAPLPPIVEPPMTLCEGETFQWHDVLIQTGQITQDETIEFTTILAGDFDCPYETSMDVTFINENEEDPTVIDTAVCSPDVFDYHGNAFGADVDEEQVIIETAGGCDSFVNITLRVLEAELIYDAILGLCSNGNISLCPSPSGTFYSHDPLDLNDNIDFAWYWTRDVDNAPVGNNDECLEVNINDFIDRIESFSVMVEISYNSKPTPPCLFGPFSVELDLDDFIPDSVRIIGPDTVCVGDEAEYTIEVYDPDRPDAFFHNWDVSGMPGVVLIDPGDEYHILRFDETTSGQICVTAENDCAEGAVTCKEIQVFGVPSGSAGLDDTECMDTYTLSATGIPGRWMVVDSPASSTSVVFSDLSASDASVTAVERGLYTFGWIVGFGDCVDTFPVNISFSTLPEIDGQEEYICDGSNENYNLVFNLTGGTPPYSVPSGNGSVTGNTFTSDLIPSGDAITVEIEDVNGCIETFVFGDYLCDCTTESGDMEDYLLEACGENGCVQGVYLGGEIPDINDALEFILHDNASTTIGTVIDRNFIGEFCFEPTIMTFGTNYYISAVIGNDLGNGMVDLTHGCTRASLGQPALWYETPVANAGLDNSTCELEYILEAEPSVGLGSWTLQSPSSGATFDDPNDPNTRVVVDICGTYIFEWKENNNDCVDSATVRIEFHCAPQLGSFLQECNDTQTGVTTSFEIEAGTAPYIELNSRGNIVDSTFSISDLPVNEPDTFYIQDANGCILRVDVPAFDCQCISAVGEMFTDLITGCQTDCVAVTYIGTNEIKDGNDILRFVVHDRPDTILGNVLAILDDPTICFDQSTMECGVIYYVSGVVGNELSGSINLDDPCLAVSFGQQITFNCLPVADAGSDAIACGNTTNLNAVISLGNGTWSQIGGNSATFSNDTDPNTQVSISSFGTYCFQWTEFNGLCRDRDTVCIDFYDSPIIDDNSVVIECNLNNTDYTVTFDIDGGEAGSIVVEGNSGSRSGDTFVSDEILSGDPYLFVVYDGNGCARDTLEGIYDCGCLTQVGALSGGPFNLCETDVLDVAALYDNTLEVLDGNDRLVYILHDGSSSPLGIPLSVNTSGLFDLGSLTLGTTYYISVVIGDESGGGNVDLTSNCLSVSDAVEVSWYKSAEFSIDASADEITCMVSQILLSVNTLDDLSDYDILWSTTDGNIQSGDETLPEARINSQGTYTLTITHELAGCSSSEQYVISQAADVPSIQFLEPDKLTCIIDEVELSAQGSSEGSSISYKWTGPGISGSDSLIVVQVNQAGIYTLTITDISNGCVISSTKEVFEDRVLPTVVATVNEKLDCNTDELTVFGLGSDEGANYNYSWEIISPEGNIIGAQDSRDINVDRPGTYQLTVVNADNGCSSTASATVEFDENVVSGAEFVLKHPGCDGEDDGRIVVQSVIGGSMPYSYSFDGGLTFIPQGFADGLASGPYTIVIRDANGCEYVDSVVLDEPFDFTLELGETRIVEFGELTSIEAIIDLPDSLIGSIRWSPLLDSANANELFQEFIPDFGQTTLGVVISNTNGCVREDRVLIVVTFSENIYIPNAVYPASDYDPNRVFYMYANPTKVKSITNLAVFNRWGERMFERSDVPPSLTLDLNYSWDGKLRNDDALPGVYVYYATVEFTSGIKKTIKGEFTLIR
jgi:hypothetical protein